MSKVFLQLILASAIIFRMGYADAKVLKLSDAPSDKKAAKPSSSPEDPKKREARRKLIEEKKVELNGTSWDIAIRSQTGKGGLSGSDQLIFQDGRFSSKNASKLGYSPTNYTLTAQEEGNGPTTWETMQTSEKEGITFWRGEWQKDSMSGVITRQLEKGSEDYYFSSSGRNKISPTGSEKGESKEVASEPSDAQLARGSAPEGTAKKEAKTKKSLFV